MRSVYEMANTLLTAVVEEMTELGVTLPTVQYVAPGQTVAFDGPQITVNCLRVFTGNPGGEDAYSQPGSFIFMSVALQVVIVRETPGLQDSIDGGVVIPTTDALDSSSQEALNDVTQLSQALINLKTKGVLVTPGVPSTVGPVSSQGPEGYVVATVGLYTVPLL